MLYILNQNIDVDDKRQLAKTLITILRHTTSHQSEKQSSTTNLCFLPQGQLCIQLVSCPVPSDSSMPLPRVTVAEVRSAFLMVNPWKAIDPDGVPGRGLCEPVSESIYSLILQSLYEMPT